MGSKIIISKFKDYVITCLHDDCDALQFHADKCNHAALLGNIYIAKVKNIVININAAFVEIENGQMCYLSLAECDKAIYVVRANSQKISVNDELIVQISKEDVKTKAPVCTPKLSLTGKYLVLNHGESGIGVSNKIEDEEIKKHLKKLLCGTGVSNLGLIARTNCINVADSLILNELKNMLLLYNEITVNGIHKSCFSKLFTSPEPFLCTIRDCFSESIEKIITDDVILYNRIIEYMNTFQKEDISKLVFYDNKNCSLNALYGITSKLSKALNEKVWLKSGGSLIIQPTEALTVIDVNTEKSITGKSKVQDHFFKINLEAAVEIAKQIRLRNLSGIIIVDFIDLKDPLYQKKLIMEFDEYLKQDPVKTNLIDMTALNLVEITRKKIRKPLYEQISYEIINNIHENI